MRRWSGLGTRPASICRTKPKAWCRPRKWKIRNFREKWYAGETISVAIGQGATTVTPHPAGGSYIGGLCDGRRVVSAASGEGRADPAPARRGDFNPENVRKVIYGMYGVVNEGGTGGRARIPGIDVCGKTGTAQLASNELLKSAKLGRRHMKDNAWFVGFAPRGIPGDRGGGAVGRRRARALGGAHRARRDQGLLRQEGRGWASRVRKSPAFRRAPDCSGRPPAPEPANP